MKQATHRLYYNADKTALVHEGDPQAAFLAVGVGDDMPEGYEAPDGDAPEASDDAPGDNAQQSDLQSLTVAELKELAEESGIELEGITRKDDIIAKIMIESA